MSDEFFDKIDAKLGQQNEAKVAKATSEDTNRAFVQDVVPRLADIAEQYAAKCKERGMTVRVSSHTYSLTFTLRYKGGQERSLVGSASHDMNGKLSFEDHYPNDDGKRYKSLPTEWYDASNWSDDKFEAKLKKTIEDFVFYADRFGGV